MRRTVVRSALCDIEYGAQHGQVDLARADAVDLRQALWREQHLRITRFVDSKPAGEPENHLP